MMHDILIIDDVVDIETQNLIENSIFSAETQWTFGRTVFSHSDPILNVEAQKKSMNFTKSLFRVDDKFSVDDISIYTKPLHNLNVEKLFTSRIQLHLPIITDKQYGLPHVDGVRNFPYKAAVYYVNDSDGDTVFYKETTKEISPNNIPLDLTVYKTVSPKKGRLIVFSGDIYHSSGKPKNDIRCIINYNFV
jgi:hypothetical protein